MNNETTLYVGVDVAKKRNSCHIMDAEGKSLDAFSISNDLEGFEELGKRAAAAARDSGAGRIQLAVEATGNYAEPLLYHFSEFDAGGADVELFRLNPRQVKRFKEMYSEPPKNDDLDAFAIADALRFGRIGAHPERIDFRIENLRQLTRQRRQLVEDLVRQKNRFLSKAFLKFGGLTEPDIFSNVFGKASMEIMTRFESAEEIAATDVGELSSIIAEASKGKIRDPDGVAEKVRKAAKATPRIPKTLGGALTTVIRADAESIHFYEGAIQRIDKSIAKVYDTIPCTLHSIPGVGKTLAAGILAEIGDVSRFPGERELAKYAGLTWRENSSGKFTADDKNKQWTGNKHLKYYVTEAADSVRRCTPEFKRYYQKKYNQSRSNKHKRALSLTARKLVRLIYSMMSEDQLYIEK